MLIVALMLVLVKCYDKMVKATPQMFHSFVDSA